MPPRAHNRKMMRVLRNLILVVAMLPMGATIAQSDVFRCGNEYTTSEEQAKERGCIRIGSAEPEPASTGELYKHPIILDDEPDGAQLSYGTKVAIALIVPLVLILGFGMVTRSRRPAVAPPAPDDQTYARVAEEMESGQIDKGLWTRLFAENDGDEPKTRAAYIRHRVQQLSRSQPGSLDGA